MSAVLQREVVCKQVTLREIRLESPSHCMRCPAGCGLSTVNSTVALPRAAADLEVRAGQRLLLTVSRRGLTATASLIFGVPLLLWLFVTWALTPYLSELLAGTMGALVLAAAFWLASRQADSLLAIIAPRLLQRSHDRTLVAADFKLR